MRFAAGVSLDRDSFMKGAAQSATRFDEIAGVTIAVFQETSEKDVWTTYVGFPRDNVMLVATDVNYLRTVLERIGAAAGPRALPESLSEWKYVDTRAPVWGLRHFQRSQTDLDPTSPLSKGVGADTADASAVGFGFWFEPAVRGTAHVMYISASGKTAEVLATALGAADERTASPREFRIRLRRPAPNVTEGSVVFTPPETFYRFLFGLLALLGHAVLV